MYSPSSWALTLSSETYRCLQYNGVNNYDHFQMLMDDDIMSLDYEVNGNVMKLSTVARRMLVIAKSYPKWVKS